MIPSNSSTSHPSCPESGRLAEVLDEHTPAEAIAELHTHLEKCPSCQQTLELLAVGKDTWGDVVQELRTLGPEAEATSCDVGDPGSALENVLADLRGVNPWELPAGREQPVDESGQLDCLRPSDTPGSLGRLGSYEALAVLGRGGMGVVLKAFDPALQRLVAIKVLAPHLAGSGAARQRFEREARAAAAITHDHVLSIHAVEKADGLPYLVMPYVAGPSLQEKLDQTGALPLLEILRIGLQTASGLAAAHAQGLIHRDVKPANILLENGVERVKITDFGLARAADAAGISQEGVVVGTPEYMAPEQARGAALDHRADLFSLGGVLYAMCTGQPPFRGGAPLAVLHRVTQEAPRPLRSLNPEIPDWLEALVMRLLAKDPAERFASAAEVAALLEQCLAGLQQPGGGTDCRLQIADCRLQIAGQSAICNLQSPIPKAPAPRPRHRRRFYLGLAAAVLPLLIIPLAWLLQQQCSAWRQMQDAFDPSREMETALPRLKGSEVQPPGADEDFAEEPLPVGAIARFGLARFRQGHVVSSLTFTADGRNLLSTSHDRTIRLWDVAASKEVRRFLGHEFPVRTASLSGDGKWLASAAADRTVRLWDMASGAEVRKLGDGSAGFLCLAFSPDSTLLAGGSKDGTVHLWDPDQGQTLHRLLGHQGDIRGLAFVQRGRALASGGADGTVRLWDVCTAKEVRQLPHGAPVNALAALDENSLASGGDDRVVRLWDVASGKERRQLRGHQGSVLCLAVSADGKYLASGARSRDARRGEITIWDPACGTAVRTLLGHFSATCTVAFTPDGRGLASGGQDHAIRLWQVATGQERTARAGPQDRARDVAFSPDGQLLATAHADGNVYLWQARSRKCLHTLQGHTSPVMAVAFLQGSTTVASAARDGTVRLWRVDSGTEIRRWEFPGRWFTCLALSPDGKVLAAGGGDNTDRGYDAASGWVWGWDIATGQERFCLTDHAGVVLGVKFSPDGTLLASSSTDRTARLWEVTSGKEWRRLNGHGGWVESVAFSADGRTLATSSRDRTVRLWQVSTGDEVRQISVGPRHSFFGYVCCSVTFSPDGRTLALGHWGTVRLLETATGQERACFLGDAGDISGIAFAPDGRALATATTDTTTLLWDLTGRVPE